MGPAARQAPRSSHASSPEAWQCAPTQSPGPRLHTRGASGRVVAAVSPPERRPVLATAWRLQGRRQPAGQSPMCTEGQGGNRHQPVLSILISFFLPGVLGPPFGGAPSGVQALWGQLLRQCGMAAGAGHGAPGPAPGLAVWFFPLSGSHVPHPKNEGLGLGHH